MFWKKKKKPKPILDLDTGPKSTTLRPPPSPPKVKEPADTDPQVTLLEKFKDLNQRSGNYFRHAEYKGSPAETGFVELGPDARPAFIIAYAKNPPTAQTNSENYSWSLSETFGKMLRRKANFSPAQIIVLFNALKSNPRVRLRTWPLGMIVAQLEKSMKQHDLSESERVELLEIGSWKIWGEKTYYGSDLQKAGGKLSRLLGEEGDVPPFHLGHTNLGLHIKAQLEKVSSQDQSKWNRLFHEAATANGSKPTKKIQSALSEGINAIGKDKFRNFMQEVLNWAAKTPDAFHDKSAAESRYYGVGQLHRTLQNLLKGLVWGMAQFHDEKSLAGIAGLAEKSFERIKGIGPAAPALGNACIYTLGASKGLSGVGHLSRLKLRIKQNNTQKLIQKKIDENAKRLGLKPAEIEEMAAPDFGLDQGVREYAFKDYTLRLTATRVGQVQLSWIKPDGTSQKSVPSFIKDSETLKKSLTAVRATAKNIKKASTAQRDRIDRLYTEDMSWTEETLQKAYLDHGLVGPLARALIWQLEIGNKKTPALRNEDVWEDAKGKQIKGDVKTIRLWHPIMDKIDVINAWRDRLEALQIRQPMKQAFREVYILTDAEVTTRVYSNRMAAHIVKQHQMNVLMATRGWAYSLLGCYDDGRDGETALKPIPAHGLTAQFWIDILQDEQENWNDSGIYHYVATDQVRFTSSDSEGVPLVDIPPIILSEILRDADLFVGVGSVGNDPTWADRDGEPRQQRYWQSYAFGDLNATAKTRKVVLERLIPRLKIKDVATIDGRFLRVQGKRHIYKIHIGSGNIQIATRGDRYLCIVPGRGKDKSLDDIYLPFEGDRGLSIVLSKAFMLAADDKIKDGTILSQLK